MALCDLGAGLLMGQAISDGTYRIQARGENVIPMCLLGTFSPYMTVHHTSVVKITSHHPVRGRLPRRLRRADRVRIVDHVAQVQPGETVVIAGIGGVGMSALQGAVISGASKVIAIDPNPWKREQAQKFGATHTYESMAAAIMPMIEATEGRMAEKVILTMGEMHGDYVEEGLILTGKAGTLVVTSMGRMDAGDVKMNTFLLSMLQKTVKGCIFGGGNARQDAPQLLSLYKAGQLNLDDMVTRSYSLEEINQGYQDMLDGKNIRGIIRYTEADW